MGQDLWVLHNVFPGRTDPGFFVEAGASDGVYSSNTYLLETAHNWTGLCCEPNRKFFARLQQNRKCAVRNCALGDRDGEAEFIEAGWFGVVPSLVEDVFAAQGQSIEQHVNYQKDFDGEQAERVKVALRSLDSLLDEVSAPETIEYLSLDVEGGELAVLSAYPFAKRRILCMTVELHYPDPNGNLVDTMNCSAVRKLLRDNGYALAKSLFVDDFFVHESILEGYRAE